MRRSLPGVCVVRSVWRDPVGRGGVGKLGRLGVGVVAGGRGTDEVGLLGRLFGGRCVSCPSDRLGLGGRDHR